MALRQRQSTTDSIVSIVMTAAVVGAVVAVVAAGSWRTARAVVEGDAVGVVAWFGLAIVAGGVGLALVFPPRPGTG